MVILLGMDVITSLLSDYPRSSLFIAFIVGVPSLVIYLLEVALVVHHSSRFNSTFFQLFTTRACVNVVFYFNNYVFMRFGMLGIFRSFYSDAVLSVSWFLNL